MDNESNAPEQNETDLNPLNLECWLCKSTKIKATHKHPYIDNSDVYECHNCGAVFSVIYSGLTPDDYEANQ